MIGHIHDALAQVRRLQELVLSRRFFEGYSGRARLLSGLAALAGAAALDLGVVPATHAAHLVGWSVVLAVALALNYGALLRWWLGDSAVRQRPVLMKPALDALPPLLAGGVLTLALARAGQFDLLPGMWMSCYGVAHTVYRQTLPGGNYAVGLFYLIAGAVCLLAPGIAFTNPWPMGLVFFAGETAGGAILILKCSGRGEPRPENGETS